MSMVDIVGPVKQSEGASRRCGVRDNDGCRCGLRWDHQKESKHRSMRAVQVPGGVEIIYREWSDDGED